MHVLITGASGYLGSLLLDCFLHSAQVSRLTVFSRDEASSSRVVTVPAFDSIGHSQLNAAAFKERKFDAVFHLAAGRESSESPQIASSLALTSKLFDVALQSGIKRIFNASSQAVYGRQQGVWKEEMPPAPVTIYGLAKYSGELMARVASDQSVSLRFSKLVGPSPKFRVCPSEIPHVLCKHAFTGRRLVIKNPAQKFDFLDVRDAAHACMKLLETVSPSEPVVLNIGSGKQIALADLARIVDGIGVRDFGKKLEYKIDESQPNEKYRDFGMEIDRMKSFSGWEPKISLEKTVHDISRCLSTREHS